MGRMSEPRRGREIERASHSCVYTGRGVEAMRQRLCVCRVRRVRSPVSFSVHACGKPKQAIAPQRAPPSFICNSPRLVKPWISIVCKLHCLAAACEHMRRSCCPRRVESEVFMRACMSSCSRAYLGHQASPASTKGVSPRSTSIIYASLLQTLASCAKRRNAQFFSGASFLHGLFNGDQRRPVCGPGCACGVRAVRCRHTARAFARS